MSTKAHRIIAATIIMLGLDVNVSLAQIYSDDVHQDKADFAWPEGIKMALSLTFDDARLTQADKGIPLLDKYGVKATF